MFSFLIKEAGFTNQSYKLGTPRFSHSSLYFKGSSGSSPFPKCWWASGFPSQNPSHRTHSVVHLSTPVSLATTYSLMTPKSQILPSNPPEIVHWYLKFHRDKKQFLLLDLRPTPLLSPYPRPETLGSLAPHSQSVSHSTESTFLESLFSLSPCH